MSVVSLLGVRVLNNPAKFNEAYNFEITFECLESLQRGLIDVSNTTTSQVPELTSMDNRSRVETHLRRISYIVSPSNQSGCILRATWHFRSTAVTMKYGPLISLLAIAPSMTKNSTLS